MSNNNTENSEILTGQYIALKPEGKKYKFNLKENGKAEHNGKNMDVTIEENADGLTYVKYKNKKYPVEILEKSQNRYHVLVNNVSYYFSIETPISIKRKQYLNKFHKDSKEGLLLAPMPGKIIDIIAEEETDVKAGDSVLILEAMKMQNEITIHRSGKVKKINVKPGDNVMKDDVLIELEK
jgi:propionyl-CoA carboxylase alpha chain